MLLCTVALACVSHSRATTPGEQIIDKLMYKIDIDDLLMMQNFRKQGLFLLCFNDKSLCFVLCQVGQVSEVSDVLNATSW